MTQQELDDIEKLIKKHKPDMSGQVMVLIILLLFIFGSFKGCGY